MTNTHVFILSLLVGALVILLRKRMLDNLNAKYQVAYGRKFTPAARSVINLIIILVGLAIMLAGWLSLSGAG